MSGKGAERLGVRHLGVLAQCPRPAGGVAEREARAYASRTLADLGFSVREELFSYSSFPGKFGAPIGGVLVAVTVWVAGWCALWVGMAVAPAVALGCGFIAMAAYARWMHAGVLAMAWCRTDGVNLVATRGTGTPRVWLVAHLDSKSQPVPSLVRVLGIAVLAAALALAMSASALTLFGTDARMLWYAALGGVCLGAVPVMASVVGERSDGAVDNASGVAAVLAAAAELRPGAAYGVLLPSAEELGLAGARAWLRGRQPAAVLNCDGVDDAGGLVIMYNGSIPAALVGEVRGAAAAPAGVRVRRMPIGLLTDSSAFAAAGWDAVTVSHGSLGTLRRIHTPADSLAYLRGDVIDDVAAILARAAEALAS